MRMVLCLLCFVAAISDAAVFADPAPANANYYAECLSASPHAKSFDRDGRYLRFACYGDGARAFFDALGRRAADVAYEETRNGDVFRFTERPKENVFGLDYCREARHAP